MPLMALYSIVILTHRKEASERETVTFGYSYDIFMYTQHLEAKVLEKRLNYFSTRYVAHTYSKPLDAVLFEASPGL